MSVVGRLSTQKKPMSSKHLIAYDLPAPLRPVMTTKEIGVAMAGAEGSATFRRQGALVRQPLVQEFALELDDRLRDLSQRALALVHRLDEPQRGAQLLIDVLPRLAVGRIAQQRPIERVHAQPRNAVFIEDDDVFAAHLVDH